MNDKQERLDTSIDGSTARDPVPAAPRGFKRSPSSCRRPRHSSDEPTSVASRRMPSSTTSWKATPLQLRSPHSLSLCG